MDKSNNETPVPLNREILDRESKRRFAEIQHIIVENNLDITPEKFWREIFDSIQFINFDKYISLVDNVIDQHKESKVIYCFYPSKGEVFLQEGPIGNSETFMIRLLMARAKRKKADVQIKVLNDDQIRQSQSLKEVVVIDDALYSGGQKASQILAIPGNIFIKMYMVASTQQGQDRLTQSLEKIGETTHKKRGQLQYLVKLKKLKDQLSPASQVIYQLLNLETEELSVDRPIAVSDDEWKQMLLKQAQQDLERPMTFNPFKLPDNRSTQTSFLSKFVPTSEDGAYIDPEYLLEDEIPADKSNSHQVRRGDRIVSSLANSFQQAKKSFLDSFAKI